ncbi:MAG: T9SS C-terminal target domain-containing protein [Ignavibacteriales bacterium]|nr:MAG: T9SS C-terminal target domain-containing protein [Ignavibacteriales bacterium]
MEESDFKVLGIFRDSSKVVGFLEDENRDNIVPAHLQFFRPQKIAGKSLQLNNNSVFSVWFPELKSDSLLAEFWIKTLALPSNFLKIQNRLNLNNEFYFSTNDFQMFSVQSDETYFSELKPGFISKNAWYHFEILFLFEEKKISVYCNGELLSQKEFTALTNPDDLEFIFNSPSEETLFQIDLLRFIKLNGSIGESFENSNYTNFISDSSQVICQFNFDNEEENLNREDVKVSSSGFQLVKSDAPVFARAPELNIALIGEMYELQWYGGDYKQAVSYILERSAGNYSFSGIYTVKPENSGEKIYTYLDNRDDNSEVVYYRVKQINKDGSIVYSSQVKIGQGILKPFAVEQNFPNPFNPKTSIYIELFEDTQVEVTIYNLEGGEIAKIQKGFLRMGRHKFSFDGTGLPSGIYLYKVDTPLYSEIKKMILTK